MTMTPAADFDDPFGSMLGYHLRRTSVAVMAALGDALAPIGINPSEATLLRLIGANDGCTQSDIARALRAQPANLVSLIQKLVLVGALRKAPGKGRAITLSLTPTGQDMHEQVCRIFDRHEARIGRALSPDQRTELVALLRQICADACCGDDRPG